MRVVARAVSGTYRRPAGIVGAAAVAAAVIAMPIGASAQASDQATDISQVKLTYRGDQATIVASWRDGPAAEDGTLEILPAAGGDFASCGAPGGSCRQIDAERVSLATGEGPAYAFYRAEATGLSPGTAYRYRVSDGAAPSPIYEFTTAAGGEAPFRAAAVGEVHIGDTVEPGWPTPAWKPTAEQIQKSGAEFTLSAGDNINVGNRESDWERLFDATPGFFGSVPFLSAPGNHETYGSSGAGIPSPFYFTAFPGPTNGSGNGRYYSYDYNGVHFVVLEANPETQRPVFDEEVRWLETDLASAAKRTRFQVVIDHSPLFHSKTSRVSTYENPEFREELVPLMDKYGVELVVSGHDKHYVRSFPLNGEPDPQAVPSIAPKMVQPGTGTTYVEVTSTGQNYPDFLEQPWMQKFVPKTAAYLQLDFGRDAISAQAIQPDGSSIDTFSIPRVPGGPDQADPVVEPAPTRPDGVTRFAGNDRYNTAAAVSAGSFPGTANDVFIVTGEDWPDALAAGAAAAEANGPVLPVTVASIPGPISAELSRLNPRRAWVVGGSSVVNDTVLDDLRARGITAERISGGDRFSTAAALAQKFFVSPPGAYYASGAGYADALGGGAAAAKRGWPLLLTAPDVVPAATPIIGNERIALGGTAAISDAVVAQLQARRIAGGDRFATAAAIARDAFTRAPTSYLATGLNFPDALAGTGATARDDAPILLSGTDCVTQATKDAAAALGTASRVVLGGTAVVTDRAANLSVC